MKIEPVVKLQLQIFAVKAADMTSYCLRTGAHPAISQSNRGHVACPCALVSCTQLGCTISASALQCEHSRVCDKDEATYRRTDHTHTRTQIIGIRLIYNKLKSALDYFHFTHVRMLGLGCHLTISPFGIASSKASKLHYTLYYANRCRIMRRDSNNKRISKYVHTPSDIAACGS